MNKLILVLFILSFLTSIFLCELNFEANVLEGTENLPLEITDKQLALQKYLAFLTILQNKTNSTFDNSTNFGWLGWESNYNYDQLYLPAVRYPLTFIGYAISALVYKTPSYRELSINIIDNVIQRLLEEHQYRYIEFYWNNSKYFPDPVVHENIMYSGHLAMLISLYESISGDFSKYSQKGWYFSWNGQKKKFYNSQKLMNAIYHQVEKGETGGVACEPNSIFVICNSHQRIAFQLFDAMHGSNYSLSNRKWENWLKKHGRAPNIWPNKDYRYFRIIYFEPAHEWIPIYGTSGNDAWALAYMNAWVNDKSFIQKGFNQILNSKEWKRVDKNQEYIDAGLFGKISQLNTWLASSLYISVEGQYSDTGRNRSLNVLNWFEKNFGTVYNPINETCNNMYTYKINDTQFQIWTTANILFGMIANNELIENMFKRPFYIEHIGEPELINVDYPRLHVKFAFYNRENNTMEFGIKTDCGDVSNVGFKILNVNTFEKAILKVNEQTHDITRNVYRDIGAKTLQFSNLNILEKSLNHFIIYF